MGNDNTKMKGIAERKANKKKSREPAAQEKWNMQEIEAISFIRVLLIHLPVTPILKAILSQLCSCRPQDWENSTERKNPQEVTSKRHRRCTVKC